MSTLPFALHFNISYSLCWQQLSGIQSHAFRRGRTIAFGQNSLNLHMYELQNYYYYPIPLHDEGSDSDSTVTTYSLDSSVSDDDQSPWDDKGLSCSTLEKYGATTASLQEFYSSDKGSAWKRISLQPQLQADDSSDSDSSSEYSDSTGYFYLCAEKTPEMTELFSDSEESIKKKRKYVKQEQSIQTLSRKRKTGSMQASPQISDSSHGPGPSKKHHSEHLPKKRQSRSRDAFLIASKQKKQEVNASQHKKFLKRQSRKQTATRGSSQRMSSSQDNDHSYHSRSKCPSYSQKAARDGPSCRKKTHSKAHYSKKPAGPEFSIQPFMETTGLHSQIGLHKRQDSYEQCRSRSPSRDTKSDKSKSNEKPGGKRKYKTRHLENAEEERTMEGHTERKYRREFSQRSMTTVNTKAAFQTANKQQDRA